MRYNSVKFISVVKSFFHNHTLPKNTVAVVSMFAVGFLFAAAHPVHAQAAEEIARVAGLSDTPLLVIVGRLIRALIGMLGIIAVLIIIYAGFKWMMARGDKTKIDEARQMLIQGLIGMVIVLASYSIATFVLRLIGGVMGPQNQISAERAPVYFQPLSGALGSSLADHYPARDAINVPRNVVIAVSFIHPIDPATLIENFGAGGTGLKTENVKIYPNAGGEDAALETNDVIVSVSEDRRHVVLDPVELLGSETRPENVTVRLEGGIRKADGTVALGDASPYEWTFGVSTSVDLDPPEVVSVRPSANGPYARNLTIAITFNEAMNPVSATGSYDEAERGFFDNIELFKGAEKEQGTYAISNGYRTVDFTPSTSCGRNDPCGNPMYCLSGNGNYQASAHAATLAEPNNDPPNPQASLSSGVYDGLVDAAGNSLNGDGDDFAEGPGLDDKDWSFATSGAIHDTPPRIMELSPAPLEGNVMETRDVRITFNEEMQSSTLMPPHVRFLADPWYEMWYSVRQDEPAEGETRTTAVIGHPTLVAEKDGGWDYYPVLTEGVRSAYQICMFPAQGPGIELNEETGATVVRDQCGTTSEKPYCCTNSETRTQWASETQCSPPFTRVQ